MGDDNAKYTVKQKEGQDFFSCNVCQKEIKTIKAMKSHISSKHKEKPVDSDDEDITKAVKSQISSKHRERPVDSDDDDPTNKKSKDDDEFVDAPVVEEEELDEWLREAETGSQNDAIQQAADNSLANPQETAPHDSMVINTANGMEGSITEAVERIKSLESEVRSQADLIKGMEVEMETKTDLLNIANSNSEELTSKLSDQESKIKKFNSTFALMKAKIAKLKEENGGGTNQEIAKKLKKANEEVKAKNKLLEESEKIKEELSLRIGKEMSLRAKAEGDTEMLQGCVKALQSVVDRQNTREVTKDKSKDKCTFLEKPGGCKKGSKCNFWHPDGEATRTGKQDCTFWLAGFCKYEEAECSKEHDPVKKGTKPKHKKKDDLASFAENLVQVLGQAKPMEAQRAPSQGLDAQNVVSLLQRALQPSQAQHTPPPPFSNPPNFLMAGRQTQSYQQAGDTIDPAQLQAVVQALQLAQAGRR